VSPIVESLVLWVAFAAGWLAVAAAALRRAPELPPVRFTWWGLVLWLVVAIPSLIQLAVPRLLEHGMRDDAIVQHGQWWRLITANVLQDGGLAGTLSNLSILAVTLLVVGRTVRGILAVPIYVVGGIGSMLLQLSNPGAGNSMATLALLTAVVVITLARPVSPATLIGSAVLILIGAGLTVLSNEHGPAILLGLAIGVVVRLVQRAGRRATTTTSQDRPSA